MKDGTRAIFEELFGRYPALEACRADVAAAYETLLAAYRAGGKVLVCGNGGSACDSEHIVGELLKKFKRHRDIPAGLKARLATMGPEGARLAERLEGSLGAVSLLSMTGILTAFANDVGWDEAYAQQLLGLGRAGDVLIAISTSGNSRNCVAAAVLAKALGVKSIGLTGAKGGRFLDVCDVTVRVPATETYQIQEYHLPVYHALCAMLENELF
ncbi:MAG: SIS domain-containing protein [Kiritimatiellia bacterium]